MHAKWKETEEKEVTVHCVEQNKTNRDRVYYQTTQRVNSRLLLMLFFVFMECEQKKGYYFRWTKPKINERKRKKIFKFTGGRNKN